MDEESTSASSKGNADPGAHQRRCHTGKMETTCVRRPVASRYMRASVGSCHDLCKKEPERRKRVDGTGNGRGRRSASDLQNRCNGRRGVAGRRVDSMGLVWSVGKAGSVVLGDGGSADVEKGDTPKGARVRTPDANLVTVDDPAPTPGPSSAKDIGRSRSGGNLSLAPSLQPAAQPTEDASDMGKMGTSAGKVLALDNGDSPGTKVSFSRGLSLERRPVDRSPRKLLFRRPTLRESQNGGHDSGRKSCRKAEPGAEEAKPMKQERVMLRHSAIERRQENRRLFNKIIEETASELVRARKGKVKALVGAFETVISLQDSRKAPVS